MQNDMIGYYSPTKIVNKRKTDITSKELKKFEDKKMLKEAIVASLLVFIPLIAFAIWASNNVGNTY